MSAVIELSAEIPSLALRSPDLVMKLDRLGSFFPTRLSFMRTIIRWLRQENITVTRPVWDIDENGFGRAVYSLTLCGYTYSLIAYTNHVDPSMRSDRVIAQVWDSTYALFDGTPTTQDLDRLEKNAPKQEAGRYSPNELVLSRANKSVRIFQHVVDRLAEGNQPDEKLIADIGYLMRTTAVYGNGKFGIADRAKLSYREGLSGPFQAELLLVWLVRGFTHDLVEHVAHEKNPDKAVKLSRSVKRNLGIGNSTGLGMAPFLVSHPTLLNNWILARETALARVRAIEMPDEAQRCEMKNLIERVAAHLTQWQVPDERQSERLELLRKEWSQVQKLVTEDWLHDSFPWHRLVNTSEQWSLECQELIISMLIEPYGDLVNELTDNMASLEKPTLDPKMDLKTLKQTCQTHLKWAHDFDFSDRKAKWQFWYVSEEKLEPRIGNRFEEDGEELEMPHDIALRVQQLETDIGSADQEQSVAEFLLQFPHHRYIIKRIQLAARYPYAEIRDNLIGENCLPIDMLRCKLSFFGASKFDPKSDRWTRINMYQGAPLFDELDEPGADDWWLPLLETQS